MPILIEIKFGEPRVQASLIIAATTVITVILGFLFKDFLIPGWTEKRSKKRMGQNFFKRYKNHLFKSALSLVYRLDEIYRTRSHYLSEGIPNGEFYDYKYKSSVYRLCVLLGWIRAYRLEEPLISIKDSDSDLHEISKALDNLAGNLADGQRVEMYVARAICRINQINVDTLELTTFEKLAVGIDHLTLGYKSRFGIDYIAELSTDNQNSFVEDLKTLMQDLSLSTAFLDENKAAIIKEVSVKLGLIYRDWQQAIGDLMLENSSDKDNPYLVIGYKRFEEMWLMNESAIEKKWLIRAERMFKDLDLRVAQEFDSRITQLRHVYASIYNLLDTLYNINVGAKPINEEAFRKIKKAL